MRSCFLFAGYQDSAVGIMELFNRGNMVLWYYFLRTFKVLQSSIKNFDVF